MERHPQDSICVRQEGNAPLPKCRSCGMHVSPLAINRGHRDNKWCRSGTAQRHKDHLLATRRLAQEMTIRALGSDLEKLPVFKYLGRVMSCSNSDWPTLYKNVQKARAQWGLIARPLIRTGATP